MIDWREHRKLAVRLAARFKPFGIMTADDYEAVALEALWIAAQRFDESKGVKFTTYAYHYIRGACRRALRDTSGVSAWAYDKGVRFQVLNWSDLDEVDDDKLAIMRDPSPSVEDTVTERDWSDRLWSEVERLRSARYNGIQTHQPDVLRAVFIDGETMAEAGRSIGLSPQAACSAHSRGLGRLRESITVRRLTAQEVG